MTKQNRYLYYILILLFFAISCKKTVITPLKITKKLESKESITISDGCYVESFIYDTLLVLVANCDSKFFHVYNKNTLKLITKFGIKGKSPHEFHSPLPYNTNTSSNANSIAFSFYDLNLVREQQVAFKSIILNKSVSESITSKSLDKELSFSNELCLLDDGRVAGRGISESKGLFFTYDKKTNKKKWINYMPKIDIEERYKQMTYYGYLCSNSKKIVYAARHFDEILFYDYNGQLLKEYYFSKIKKPILSKKFSGVSSMSMQYMMRTYSTHEFCYVLRLARTGEDFRDTVDKPSQILVFNWEGDLINVYQHQSCPICYCVDETTSTMYCIAKGEDLSTVELQKIPL